MKLAILAGGELLGSQALLAVPLVASLVASLSVVVDEVQRERLQRRLNQATGLEP
ncbi:MAG: hypothetical protein M3069_20375 [Chloroflexota bacterium]|nr:hypothetical protein [Chloroflexota bacterium]